MKILHSLQIETPLGPMIAVADSDGLYVLEFIEQSKLKFKIDFLSQKLKMQVKSGKNNILNSLSSELINYFKQKAPQKLLWNTPIHFSGTPFQNNVWAQLLKIPSGETQSYMEIAKAIRKPRAYRAVAQANGANRLCIIIPCHRVINANGALGGYSSGLERKKWLLQHEKAI